ncbi:MAG: hypothetical protein H7Y60_01760 [Rhodospirillaceae bacterium]|nr:hypothetical protein [Rhodospirillales bacterium]
MRRVHVLSDDFASPNGLALLFPLVLNRRALKAHGVDLRILAAPGPELTQCDTLIVDSKVFRDHWGDGRATQALDTLASWAERTPTLFFDTTDSTGWVNAAVLPLVRGYYKNQALKDRSLYAQSLYGGRAHTDYAHGVQGITDEAPGPSWPPADPALAERIRVSWNSGFADYSFQGLYRSRLYRRLRLPGLLKPPGRFVAPGVDRPVAVSARMSTRYSRATVAWQRLEATRLLGDRVATDRLSRRDYLREMESSRVIVSPFGFGEINYRDWECFLSGALLIKPDCSHMETWPNLFRGNETILCHHWSCADLPELVERALTDYPRYVEIARQGQADYRRAVASAEGRLAFRERFAAIIADAISC